MLKLLDCYFSKGKYLFHHLLVWICPTDSEDCKFLDFSCFLSSHLPTFCKKYNPLRKIYGTRPSVFIDLKPVLSQSNTRMWLVRIFAWTHGESKPTRHREASENLSLLAQFILEIESKTWLIGEKHFLCFSVLFREEG